MKVSETRLSRSGVVSQGGGSEISQIRTSYGVFLNRGEDDIVKREWEPEAPTVMQGVRAADCAAPPLVPPWSPCT